MTAPSADVRGTPDGIMLADGFSTVLTLENDLTIEFWEKTVEAPAMEGGEPIEQTTMHNTTWRTMAPRGLVTLEPFTLTASYDPVVYDSALAQLNVEQTITIMFSDGSTLAFYGFLRRFEPSSNEEGTQPECTITIVPTNRDPSTKAEEAPVLVEVAGT